MNPKVNVFDQAARISADTDPLGFLRWVVPGLAPSLRFAGWLDTRTHPFPGTPDRTCDTVANLAEAGAGEAGPRWALVVEFQTEPETEMRERLLEYVVRLRRGLRFGPERRDKFHVVGGLVNLTGPPQPDTLEMDLPGVASPFLHFFAATRTLRVEDARHTLDRIAAGQTSRSLLGWISLMRGGGQPDIIERWKLVASQEPEKSRRASYGAIVRIFSELTDCVAQWKSGLEEWEMRESTVVLEWKAEGKAEGLAVGKAEGLAVGKAEGITEGLVEGRREGLLQFLGLKFGPAIPPDLAEKIKAQADVDVLSRWFRAAFESDSTEAFRGAMGS